MLLCTHRLQKELNLQLELCEDPTDPEVGDSHSHFPLGHWYAELFWCERRKCVLFTSTSTYLSFLVLDVFRSEMRPFRDFFIRNLGPFLKSQGVPSHIRDELLKEHRNVVLQGVNDLPELEVIKDFVFHARFLISHAARGIRDVDAMEISQQLCDVPVNQLPSVFPWRAARIALGLESEKAVGSPVRSLNPLARRVGSPTLMVIEGGALG